MRELHFYSNLCDIDNVSEWDLDTMCTDYVTTKKAIEDSSERIVKTTQMSFLINTWDYIDSGFVVFLHNNSNCYIIKEHMPEISKDITRSMNILKLYLGNTFGEIC